MSHNDQTHKTSRKSYFIIFALLAVFTVLEVAVAHPSLAVPKLPMAISLIGLALVKAAMVAFFFMHLKDEMPALKWTVVVPFAFPTLYAFVLIAEASWRLLP